MQAPASWQRRSFALLAVSIGGTALAGVALAFDGWLDALALYVACVLVLVLLLCRFAEQWTEPQFVAPAGGHRTDPGACPAGLVLTGTPGAWPGVNHAAVPAALRKTAPTD